MGQCWETGETKRQRSKSQIMLLVTFIPALPKNVCFVFAWFFFLPVPCLPWSYCLCKSGWLLSVYGMYRGGRTQIPPFPLFLQHWLTFNNDVAVTLQSKSFKWKSNVKLIDKILLYGSLIIFLKLYFFKKHWIQLQPSHFDRSDSIAFFVCLFFFRPTGTFFVRLG